MSDSRYLVYVPGNFSDICGEVPIYGFYHKSTRIFNIVGTSRVQKSRKIGIFGRLTEKGLCGINTDNGFCFYNNGVECDVQSYNLKMDVFSRNSGILETTMMMEKTAVIVGCGSVGSLVALQLARSGVGRFLLIDSDILEYHNVCRHQCGIESVGSYKVDLIRDRILSINPSAFIKVFKGAIQRVPLELFEEFCNIDSIVIGCADNRSSDVYSNRVAMGHSSAYLSIGFWERANVGEIFYWLPKSNMPCYECALGFGVDSTLSGKVSANNHHVYVSNSNLDEVNFEPGIYADISFITEIGVKLALDILNRNSSYRPRLLNSLTQYTLICNTCDPQIGGDDVEIFSYPLQVTTSLEVSFQKHCIDGCRWYDE